MKIETGAHWIKLLVDKYYCSTKLTKQVIWTHPKLVKEAIGVITWWDISKCRVRNRVRHVIVQVTMLYKLSLGFWIHLRQRNNFSEELYVHNKTREIWTRKLTFGSTWTILTFEMMQSSTLSFFSSERKTRLGSCFWPSTSMDTKELIICKKIALNFVPCGRQKNN